jgi:hypothetical protein
LTLITYAIVHDESYGIFQVVAKTYTGKYLANNLASIAQSQPPSIFLKEVELDDSDFSIFQRQGFTIRPAIN